MTESALATLLLSVAVLMATALGLGSLARRGGSPAIAGELAAGVILGPTVLARLAPEAQAALFPSAGPVAVARQAIVTAGLLGFLFVAGLEMDVSHVRQRAGTALSVSACGLFVPFALGALAVSWRPAFFGTTLSPALLAIFVGTALSISALPVIARTLIDLGLQHTRLAGLVLGAAIVDDLAGWSLFAFVSRRARGGDAGGFGAPLLIAAALLAVAMVVGRPLARALRPRIRAALPETAPRLALAAVCIFAGAALTERLGIHAVFGAFLIGVVLSQGRRHEEIHDICHAFGTGVLAPLYFASIGLTTDFLRHFDLGLSMAVLAIACLGKWGAAALAGRLSGLGTRESIAIGVALNARGAMEILLARVALEQGLIEERLFVSLVTMALATSLMSAPLLSRLVGARAHASIQ
jgi:Kef-type K+ transport system membrane component KefB